MNKVAIAAFAALSLCGCTTGFSRPIADDEFERGRYRAYTFAILSGVDASGTQFYRGKSTTFGLMNTADVIGTRAVRRERLQALAEKVCGAQPPVITDMMTVTEYAEDHSVFYCTRPPAEPAPG